MILCQVSGTGVCQDVPVSLLPDASYQPVLLYSVLSALGVRSNPKRPSLENILLVEACLRIMFPFSGPSSLFTCPLCLKFLMLVRQSRWQHAWRFVPWTYLEYWSEIVLLLET